MRIAMFPALNTPLHPRRRHRPERLIEIDLGSIDPAKFVGALENRDIRSRATSNEQGRPVDETGRPWTFYWSCETDLKMACTPYEHWLQPIRKNFRTPFCTPTALCADTPWSSLSARGCRRGRRQRGSSKTPCSAGSARVRRLAGPLSPATVRDILQVWCGIAGDFSSLSLRSGF